MKAIALIQIGKDLNFCDFSLENYKGDEFEFMDTVRFHFEERVGPENISPLYVRLDYFMESKEYEIIDITLTETP
jgi:hypothetical protein